MRPVTLAYLSLGMVLMVSGSRNSALLALNTRSLESRASPEPFSILISIPRGSAVSTAF